MENKKIVKKLTSLVHLMEFIVALFILLLVVAGFVEILKMTPFMEFFQGAIPDFQITFQHQLSNVLLLIVGIELALLLIKRNPDYIIDIMLFVIARKLLINTDEIWELAIGILALAAIFAVRKFLICKTNQM
ncbi:hypothetical protein ACFL3T_03595 [Patescibacteria group bacterium]